MLVAVAEQHNTSLRTEERGGRRERQQRDRTGGGSTTQRAHLALALHSSLRRATFNTVCPLTRVHDEPTDVAPYPSVSVRHPPTTSYWGKVSCCHRQFAMHLPNVWLQAVSKVYGDFFIFYCNIYIYVYNIFYVVTNKFISINNLIHFLE